MNGRTLWVHCNNSGSMLGVLRRGRRVFLSPAKGPRRKLPYTLEMIQLENGTWVGVNTLTPNRILQEAWKKGLLPQLAEYETFRREAMSGRSRLDALLVGPCGRLWVEAKNVTLVEGDVAYFPDAVTQRGRRHLEELMGCIRNGDRAACFYLVQHGEGHCFSPADFIDPQYADCFWKAREQGVKIWPYLAELSPSGIRLGSRLPLLRVS